MKNPQIGPASRQAAQSGEPPHGPRARMRRTLLDTAQRMMAAGITPSVAELAEAAEVSRATAYRYFPSQSALIAAVVDQSLGPLLDWQARAGDAGARVDELLTYAYPRLEEHEAPLRAALMVSLQQQAAARAGDQATPLLVRGHRVDTLRHVLAPLADRLEPAALQRVAQALSLLYGTEVFLVLKDIWKLDLEGITDVVRWTAQAIIAQAERDAAGAAGGQT
ncbi:TetR/AcrR family transcriptional regulator [Bordetella genomosp. 5]|nr:TetR/AcrR family transcriptional regulator [Bordetella genomosp. 5]